MTGETVWDVAIHPMDSNIVYVINDSGISKTVDGGLTWTPADSGIYIEWFTGPYTFEIHPTQPETLYCGTAGHGGGGLYKSTNGGLAWFPVHCDSSEFVPCSAMENGVISTAYDPNHPDTLFAGINGSGHIVKTTTGGEEWEFTGFAGYQLPLALAVSPLFPETILAGFSFDGLKRSTDGGLTWERVFGGLPTGEGSVIKIDINPERPGEIACTWGATGLIDIFHSLDGGLTWSSTQFPDSVDLIYGDIAVSPINGLIYAGGSHGFYSHVIMSGIEDEDGSPKMYRLSQNYPNPFNPSTTIRFAMPRSGDVSLKIFNLLGEEVATLVSGYRDAGTHTVQWDATGQPSGVYFYRLRARHIDGGQAGEFVETKRFVLIR